MHSNSERSYLVCLKLVFSSPKNPLKFLVFEIKWHITPPKDAVCVCSCICHEHAVFPLRGVLAKTGGRNCSACLMAVYGGIYEHYYAAITMLLGKGGGGGD